MVVTCLLGNGGHSVIAAPNYATNLETPRSLGTEVTTLDLRFEDRWALDLERLEAALRPDTWLVSLTYPHNPTGAMIGEDTLRRAIEIVESHPTARLLVDETYRDLAYGEPLPVAASISDRAISVSSMSKTFGLPGLRIGWVISRDAELSETLLAAKEQILICGSAIDEEMALRILQARPRLLPPIRKKIQDHLEIVRGWIEGQSVFEWVEPQAGVVCMPRFREQVNVDIDAFYSTLLDEHGTYVGPGHWFDQDRRSFRLGFAWPEADELKRGLAGLLAAAERAAA
jgi:aspartate/methionine/tyrosine aminotransferase